MGSSYPGLFVTASPDESGRSVKTYPQLRATVGSRERPAKWVELGETGAARDEKNGSIWCFPDARPEGSDREERCSRLGELRAYDVRGRLGNDGGLGTGGI